MSKIAYAYLRASTDPKKQKNSIDVQNGLIQSFADRNGYTIVQTFVEYRSGGDDERAEFNKCLEQCIKENAYLLTYKVDRMSRSLSIFKKIESHLSRFRFVELGNQEPNLLTLSVLLAVAQQERINTGARVKATYEALKARNPDHPWGNKNMARDVQPLGELKRVENATAYNTKIQSLCSDLKQAGYCTLNDLAVKLNQIGITTRRGSRFSPSNLHRILDYGV